MIPAAIHELLSYMTSIAATPQGPPAVLYSFPDETGGLQVDTCWPAGPGVEGDGRIEAATLPASIALGYLHRGPYEELRHTHAALHELLAKHGTQGAGPACEVYISDPAEVPDPADYETVVQYPVVPETARAFGAPVAAASS